MTTFKELRLAIWDHIPCISSFFENYLVDVLH